MKKEPPAERPLVSVVLATYNEARSIERCIASLLEQETPNFDLEILAVDGESRDGTREILEKVAAADRRVRVLTNHKRRAPFAFNLGLRDARGEYVCIFGAHTVYAKDYISVCLRELIAHNAVGCGGRVVTQPSAPTPQARLVTWALSHPFGSSRKSFRTQQEGFADTVNYPIMLREALLEVGGYDEELLRNQDNDTNQKLRAKGYTLYCTWKTRCFYHPKGTVRDLLAYAAGNGFWNVISLKKNRASMAAHHFIPFLFLLGLLSTLLLGVAGVFLPSPYRAVVTLPFAALLGLHLCVGSAAALQVAIRERSLEPLWLPFIFLGFHVAYGYGTLSGFARNAKPPTPAPDRLLVVRG
ncbi:MAG: glycosyltransferase [Acidobacteriia bacterium]|nr:glycosyltransferase [Terriglobia bacterium]